MRLRFVAVNGKLILQQWWAYPVVPNNPPAIGEWRDVPIGEVLE